MLVAYRYGKPSIVRPNEVYQLPLLAFYPQRFALASVSRVVPLCKKKGTLVTLVNKLICGYKNMFRLKKVKFFKLYIPKFDLSKNSPVYLEI